MLAFFHEGGFSMVFILLFGMIALLSSLSFAVRPAARSERFIEWSGRATLGATLGGICSNFATVFHVVGSMEMPADQRLRILMVGAGESLAPGILGFALYALTSFMLAVGKRRLDGAIEPSERGA